MWEPLDLGRPECPQKVVIFVPLFTEPQFVVVDHINLFASIEGTFVNKKNKLIISLGIQLKSCLKSTIIGLELHNNFNVNSINDFLIGRKQPWLWIDWKQTRLWLARFNFQITKLIRILWNKFWINSILFLELFISFINYFVSKHFNGELEWFASIVKLCAEFVDGGAVRTRGQNGPSTRSIGPLIGEEHSDVKVEQLVDGPHFHLERLGILGNALEPFGQRRPRVALKPRYQLGNLNRTALRLQKNIRPIVLISFIDFQSILEHNLLC